MDIKWKLGTIKFYDKINQEGLLECSDGNYYEFNSESLDLSIKNPNKLKKNKKVKFNAIEFQNFYLADIIKEAK